ncbi:Uncharacterized protein TCAP_03329 [Tolypocladium capitatum]|uniref:Uncharacterized protein n=1 Tax=Tolypocladium capitatum TaxID=45235 RepID=A0A2K3QGV4_9HYPO|nr:Uncharacterized protein TCAP_03329 [Tolypocladium capitatum]
MAGSLDFFFALLLLCALARGAPDADPTPTLPTAREHGLPGFVAHEDGQGDGNGQAGRSQPGPRHTDGGCGGGGDNPPPPYTPIVTPPPDQDALLASQGHSQETYYTCNTVAGSAHCGWHVPLVEVPKADAAAALRLGGPAAAVACLAGLFALGMM